MNAEQILKDVNRLIDGNVSNEDKIEIIERHFIDWDIYDGFLEDLTDGEMLDMIYRMTFKEDEEDFEPSDDKRFDNMDSMVYDNAEEEQNEKV
jgi:hypothetical protein